MDLRLGPLCGLASFDEFGIDLARNRGCKEMTKEFHTHPPFRKEGFPFFFFFFCNFVGSLKREVIESLKSQHDLK